MKTRIMLDLETLGTRPGSVILSIGAVKFDHEKVYDDFHIGINIQSCLDAGMTVNGDTLMWWMHPDRNEARAQWVDPAFDKFDLGSALSQFTMWMKTAPNGWIPVDGPEVELWGNGSSFDNSILGAAYDALGFEAPWQRDRANRCYRTMKSMYPNTRMEKREGTHHNAVDDARSQAHHLRLLPAFQEMCRAEILAESLKVNQELSLNA